MSNVKITDLPGAGTITGNELIPLVQGGVTSNVTVDALRQSVHGIIKAAGTNYTAAIAGTDYVAPNGALGAPSSGDLSNCTGVSLSSVSGTLDIAQGGTGATTAASARTALGLAIAVNVAPATTGSGILKASGGGFASAVADTDYLTPTTAASTYAPTANGVTHGDSHDHSGGDGAQINHTTLSNIGANTHAQLDTAVGKAAIRYIQIVAVPSATALVDGANIIGAIECPVTGTITALRAKTTSGTGTVDFKRGGVSMGAVAATSSGVTNAAPTNNAATALDDLTFDVSSSAGSGLVLMLTVQE